MLFNVFRVEKLIIVILTFYLIKFTSYVPVATNVFSRQGPVSVT